MLINVEKNELLVGATHYLLDSVSPYINIFAQWGLARSTGWL